jgi:hypothetical protein
MTAQLVVFIFAQKEESVVTSAAHGFRTHAFTDVSAEKQRTNFPRNECKWLIIFCSDKKVKLSLCLTN